MTDTTLSIENDVDLRAEQNSAPPIEDTGTTRQPDIAEPEAPPAPAQAEPEKPIDKRAARLEEIAERSRERSFNELERTRETFTKPEAPIEAPALKDDDKIVLRVRRNAVEMTVRDRNNLLLDEHDAEEIAAMSEFDKKAVAQRILANRSYDEDIARKREEMAGKPPNPLLYQQPPAQPEKPAEPVKTPKELAFEKFHEAGRQIAYGENLEEAQRAQAEAMEELVRINTNEATETALRDRRQQEIASAYDRNARQGLETVIKSRPEFNDEVAARVLSSQYATIQRASIDYYLENSPPAIKQAFEQAGIKREALLTADASAINHLYRDMIVKDHRLPPPAVLMEKAAELTADKLFGTTPPQPPGNTPPAANVQPSVAPAVDRSDRKAGLHQPARAGIPQSRQAQAAPLSEQERAKANIAKMKQDRRGIPAKR